MARAEPEVKLICDFCSEPVEAGECITGHEGCICFTCLDTCVFLRDRLLLEAKGPLESVPKPVEVFNFLDRHVVGQTDTKKRLAVAVRDHCMRVNSPPTKSVKRRKTNVLLVGPTGVGKTLLARTLAEYLQVPFIIESATALTEAGYHGQDVENMILRLYQAAGKNKEKAERGIIYVDEVDKLAIKYEGERTHRDVGGEGVQQALLPMLEDRLCNVGGDRPVSLAGGDKNDKTVISTANILFICGGAFVGLEKTIQRRMSQKALGFMASMVRVEPGNPDVFLKHVTPADIIGYGFIPELIGRLPVIATLDPLTTADLVRVLTEPENSLVKQYEERFKDDGGELVLEAPALQAIAEEAIKRKTGARGLDAILEDLLLEIRFQLPSDAKPGSHVVTSAMVKTHFEKKAAT